MCPHVTRGRCPSFLTFFLPSLLPPLAILSFLIPSQSLAATPVFKVGAEPETTGAQIVRVHGPDAMSQLGALIAGRGVPGTNPAEARDAGGGTILWRQSREESDELGMAHRFYRQYYVLPAAFAQSLDPAYARDGVELYGSGFGMHFKDDALRTVFGAQFRELVVLNLPVLGWAADVYDAAQAALATYPGFEVPTRAVEIPELKYAHLHEARLLLASCGDGTNFRFVWKLAVLNARRVPYSLLVDAELGTVLSVVQTLMADGPCDTTDESWTTATAIPQFGGSNHTVWATPDANDGYPRRQIFSHEAHRPAMGGIPEIVVYQYLATQEGYNEYDISPWSCGSNLLWGELNCGNERYAVVPLASVGGTVEYDDSPVNPMWELNLPYQCGQASYTIHGRAAGDAMWNTYLTMQALYSDLYRYGFDGSGSTLRLVIEEPGYGTNNSRFVRSGEGDFPTPAVSFWTQGTPGDGFVSSDLATVAHEWGHGVALSCGLPFDTDIQMQLHEGFADVVGYAVDWYRGANPNWLFQDEYSQGWKRRVDSDNTNGAFHSSDSGQEQHFRGNALGVIYYMLKEGRANPACERLSNCNLVPDALDQRAARILFRTLTVYVDQNTGWSLLNELARASAFDLYSFCSIDYSALPEQQDVDTAFQATGYAGVGYYFDCP